MDIASKRLKCSNCNIVICEVLAFVQNKIDVMTEVSLVQICESAFSSEEIEVAKSLLFESVSKPVKTRKRQGKTLRNIEDIICLFKETDPEQVPIFVARNLEKLPPVTFDHVDVTPLLKRIVLLEKSIHDLPLNYVSKSELKDHFNLMSRYKDNSFLIQEKNINNRKRGGGLNNTIDSGPMALSTLCNNVSFTDEIDEPTECVRSCHSSPIIEVEVGERVQLPPPAPVPAKCAHSSAEGECGSAAGESGSAAGESGAEAGVCALRRSTSYTNGNAVRPVLATVNKTDVECACTGRLVNTVIINETDTNYVTNSSALSPSKHASFTEVLQREGEWKMSEKDEAWHVVQRHRFKNRLISQKGSAVTGSGENNFRFKAATDVKVPLFISNVHRDVAEQDIIDYIYEKTRETVSLVKIKMKQERSYNAYKLYVTKNKIATFLDDKLWPSGISFRRFVNFYNNRQKSQDPGLKTVASTEKTNNI